MDDFDEDYTAEEGSSDGELDSVEFGQGSLNGAYQSLAATGDIYAQQAIVATQKSVDRNKSKLAKRQALATKNATQGVVRVKKGKALSKARLSRKHTWMDTGELTDGSDEFEVEENGILPVDLFFGRMDAMDDHVQARFYRILHGSTISGAYKNADAANTDSRAVVEKFEQSVGMSAQAYIKRYPANKNIFSSMTTITTYKDGDVTGEHKVGNSSSANVDDIVVSMMSKTADPYLEHGSVSGQNNRYQTSEQETRADLDFVAAMKFIDTAADRYMMDVTGSAKFKAARKEATKEALFKHLIDANPLTPTVALPNDMNVMGLVPTLSFNPHRIDKNEIKETVYSGQQGTPFNTRQFSDIKGELSEDDQWKYKGSARDSLFPIQSKNKLTELYGEEKAIQMIESNKLHYQDFYDSMKKTKNTLLDQMQNHDGERRYQSLYSAVESNSMLVDGETLQVDTEQFNSSTFYNEAAELELERYSELSSGGQSIQFLDGKSIGNDRLGLGALANPSNQYVRNQIAIDSTMRKSDVNPLVSGIGQGKSIAGSESGGMHGEREMSQVQIYVEARHDGYSRDAAHEIATFRDPREMRDIIDAGKSDISEPRTDREKYLAKIKADNAPKQGSDEWLALRVGKITGSIVGKIGGPMGKAKLAFNMAKEELARNDENFDFASWRGNAWTSAGNANEPKVLKSFLANNPDLVQEEAFFEKFEHNENFGASPDGRLFNKETGEGRGLLELKALTSKSLVGSLERYNKQMQWQMLVTGETQTRFYAMATDSQQVVDELVQANPKVQEKMIKDALAVLEVSKETNTYNKVAELRDAINSKTGLPTTTNASNYGDMYKGQEISYMESKGINSYEAKEEVVGPYRSKIRNSDLNVSEKNDAFMDIMEGNKLSETAAYRLKGMSEVQGEAVAENDSRNAKARAMSLKQVSAKKEMDSDAQGKEDDARKMALLQLQAEKEMAKEVADAKKEEAKASRETSKALKEMANNMKRAGKVAADVLSAGADSSMDTIERAAEAGVTPSELRGVEDALGEGGAGIEGAKTMTSQAVALKKQLSTPEGRSNYMAQGLKNIAYMRTMGFDVSQDQLGDMDNLPTTLKGTVNYMKGLGDNMSIEARASFLALQGVDKKFAVNRSTDEEIMNASSDTVKVDKTFKAIKGSSSVAVSRRTELEGMGASSYKAGVIGAVAAMGFGSDQEKLLLAKMGYERYKDSNDGKFDTTSAVIHSLEQVAKSAIDFAVPSYTPQTTSSGTEIQGKSEVNIKNIVTVNKGGVIAEVEATNELGDPIGSSVATEGGTDQ